MTKHASFKASHLVCNILPMEKASNDNLATLSLLSLTYSLIAVAAPTTIVLSHGSLAPPPLLASDRASDRASTRASSIATAPPWPMYDPMVCMASPATVTVPFRKPANATCHGGRYHTLVVTTSASGSEFWIISRISAGHCTPCSFRSTKSLMARPSLMTLASA